MRNVLLVKIQPIDQKREGINPFPDNKEALSFDNTFAKMIDEIG